MTDHVYVWTEPPGDTAGIPPLVRAANGEGTTGDGFDFRANYRAWCDHVGHSLAAWTYMYPGDQGGRVASALLDAAPGAPFYIIDIEAPGISGDQVALCADALHQHAPVGCTTWGLVAQATQRGVPVHAYGWDIISPQTYYAYQSPGLVAWTAYGSQVVPSVSPADWSGWTGIARAHPVFVWRLAEVDVHAVAGWLSLKHNQGGAPTPPQPPASSVTDVYMLPTLKQGAVVAMARRVQALLDAAGYRLSLDGDFGPRTDSAVRHAQSVDGLAVDGVVGPRTWHMLLGVPWHQTPATGTTPAQDWPNIYSLPTIAQGMTDVHARTVQALLVADGYVLPVDGIYGPQTIADVVSFQQKNRLAVDGVVGSHTWHALLGVPYPT